MHLDYFRKGLCNMATKLTTNSIAGDNLIFEDIIGKAYKHAKNADPLTLLRCMVNDGVIQVDALFEKAVSQIGKIQRDSTTGRDFVDGSDAKKVTTSWCIDNSPATPSVRRVASIMGLKNKKGALRCIVAETETNKVYYFKIPYTAYSGLKSVRIYFNEDGTPKATGNFWKWQCRTFTEMAS